MDIQREQQNYLNSKPSFLGRGIERLTNPVGKALASVVPGRMVESVIRGIDSAVGQPRLVNFSHDQADLQACRREAKRVERTARRVNTATGMAAGFAGALTASADIPASIAVALRNIRDTGRAYGYPGEGKREQLFRLQVLEMAALDSKADRKAYAAGLNSDIEPDGSLRPVEPKSIEPLVDQAVERVSRAMALAAFRQRAGMIVPLVGSAVGGIVNWQFQQDVSRAARYAYQARRLRADA